MLLTSALLRTFRNYLKKNANCRKLLAWTNSTTNFTASISFFNLELHPILQPRETSLFSDVFLKTCWNPCLSHHKLVVILKMPNLHISAQKSGKVFANQFCVHPSAYRSGKLPPIAPPSRFWSTIVMFISNSLSHKTTWLMMIGIKLFHYTSLSSITALPA